MAKLRRYWVLWPLGAALLLCPAMAVADGHTFANNPIVLDQREEYHLGRSLDLMEDAGASLEIEQVISALHVHRFKPGNSDIPNLGVKRSAIWARFTLRNLDQQARILLLVYRYPPVDFVSLYIPVGNGGFQRLEGGDSAAQTSTAIRHRYPVFRLTVPPHSSQTYYLRVKTTGAMTIPISLVSFSRFYEEDHLSQVISGILFGLVVGAVLYFSSMAWKLRSSSVLWFVIYISLLGLMILAGKGFLQEWLGPRANLYNNLLHLVIIGLVYFSGAKFLRLFLQIDKYSPKIDKCLHVLQWMGIFYIPMCIFENAITPLYSAVLVGAGPIFSTVVAGLFWARGVPNAKYFFLGWLGGHIFSAVDLLRIYGVVPFTSITPYVLPAAMCISLALFARALIQQASLNEQMAKHDMLTGLANRHAMDQFISTEYSRNLRHGHPMAMIMADVDHFKEYNDSYGHQAGDECLAKIAEILKHVSRRSSEIAARYGGEEFALVLSDYGLDEAAALAEQIRAGVENLRIIHPASHVAKVVTISLGVACLIPARDADPMNLIAQADQALYQAKRGGRNQVVVADDISVRQQAACINSSHN